MTYANELLHPTLSLTLNPNPKIVKKVTHLLVMTSVCYKSTKPAGVVGRGMGRPTAIVLGREMRMSTISVADELSGTMPLNEGLGWVLCSISILYALV